MSSTLSPAREAARGRILDAATRAVAAGGLDRLRIRDVAAEVDRSVGHIYTFFPDIDALAMHVNSRTIAVLRARISEDREQGGRDPRRRLLALARTYARFAHDEPGLWSALFDRPSRTRDDAPEWHRREHAELIDLVAKPLGELLGSSRSDVRSIAHGVFAAVHGIVAMSRQRMIVSVPQQELETVVETIVSATLSGFEAEVRR